MMKLALVAGAFVCIAHGASAQGILSTAKEKAQKAAAATNAHIEAEQHPEQQGQPTAQKPAAKAPAAKAPAAPVKSVAPTKGKAAPASKDAKGAKGAQTKLDVAASDTAGPPPSIMREQYAYSADGRRDPFVSLMMTSDLRPAISDLRLTGIVYVQANPDRSVATLRDLGTQAQYRVSTGATLGRMHVSAIRPRVVVFTIEEFGSTRRDSLMIGDPTKERAR